LPVWSDPNIPSAAPRLTIGDGPAAHATLLSTLPSRVSAIVARTDGVLFLGTFDAGVYRFQPAHDRAPVAVGELDGRERFVDALLEHEGRIAVGTHRGAVLLDGDGRRTGVVAAGEAIAALATVDGELVLGTAHGIWVGGKPLDARGPDGSGLRVTALAASAGRLWVGTAEGVYALERPLRPEVAAWYPLVFGTPPASTDVVTALVPLDDGVLAGTDDGGLARVSGEGVAALPFAERGANQVNPGALARLGDAIFVGTEGGGLLRVSDGGAAAMRPRDWSRVRVSAVAAGGELYIGTEEGELWTIHAKAASRIFWIKAS
jgi:ligand-binding sensor domain-containing protein